MSQYAVTCAVTNGSATVTGATGTLFITNGVAVNHEFYVPVNGTKYIIAALTETTLTLSTVYSGTTNATASAVVQKDFTTNRSYPKTYAGDASTADVIRDAIQLIDTDMNSALTGAVSWSMAAKTANYTVLSTDTVVTGDATAGNITFTLPTAVGRAGQPLYIKKIDSSAYSVIIDAYSTETIDGGLTFSLSYQWEAITLISDGANWLIL